MAVLLASDGRSWPSIGSEVVEVVVKADSASCLNVGWLSESGTAAAAAAAAGEAVASAPRNPWSLRSHLGVAMLFAC